MNEQAPKRQPQRVHEHRIFLFRKHHTAREKAQYIVDPDSPDLTLLVPNAIHVLKWAYVAVNIAFTLASCGALIWLSYPQYVENVNGGIYNMNFLNWVELISVIFFVFDYIIRFILTDKKWYIFMIQLVNIIDVLATVPYFITLILISVGVNTVFFRVFFVFRMFRIIRLSKYNPGMHLIMETLKESLAMLVLFVICVILIIVIVSTAYFFAERGSFDREAQLWMRPCPESTLVLTVNDTWVEVGYHCEEQPAPYQSIIETMYWGVVMLSTTGYHADAPVTDIGRVIAVITSVFGVFFFAAPATILATNYKNARQNMESEIAARQFDKSSRSAMKAQEELRKELERVWKLKDNTGRVKFKEERTLTPVAEFVVGGVKRTIYEVTAGCTYVYEPLIVLQRKNGKVLYTDDFNLVTAQRVLTCYLITDSIEARNEARRVLEELAYIPAGSTESAAFVSADPLATIQIQHDFEHVYPDLGAVVYLDKLQDFQASNLENAVPVRFVIDMPHVHAVSEIIPLLERTMIHVSMGIRKRIYMMHIPLYVDNLMATRLVRELFIIAHERKNDKAHVAYVHPHDVAQLLEGFCNQFIPTPSSDVLIISPELVDQQVTAAICTSFPLVKLDWIPPEGANACYRSNHLNISSIHDSYLLEVNLTQLAQLDKLGYGHRFKIQVPISEEDMREVNFQLI